SSFTALVDYAYGPVNSAASASIAAAGRAVTISTSQNNGATGWAAGGRLRIRNHREPYCED
ncbi:MAG: hypothetical protein ACREDJ_08910, partial [Methylocella sp.]